MIASLVAIAINVVSRNTCLAGRQVAKPMLAVRCFYCCDYFSRIFFKVDKLLSISFGSIFSIIGIIMFIG